MRFIIAPEFYDQLKDLEYHLPDCYVRPGEYLLHARGSEYESEEISFRITPGTTTTVSLPMVSRMAYALEFVCPDGAKVSQVEVEIRGFDDGALKKRITVVSDEQGRLISRFELTPGIYTLTALAGGLLTVSAGPFPNTTDAGSDSRCPQTIFAVSTFPFRP